MKFSEAWLREWVNPSLSREDLLSQLTMAGLEVDGVEGVAGEFSGVVVGRVESCEKHPDADKLSVCEVSDGEDVHQVVCGAPNVRAGLVTAFAKVGAVLPENFKIKKAKLRGVESKGMLCSPSELGIGDDHDGIMELSSDLTVGQDLTEALHLNDVIVDVDLTPNRGDCLSLTGLAREVGVLNNLSVQYPQVDPVPAQIEDTFPVAIQQGEGCPRYLGRVIKGIDLTQPSPNWMVERLRRCGLRSIDPVVDVTNYVLIELGQPMHAFDLNQIHEGIVVRMAKAQEKLTLLDGQEVELDEQTLLITDGNGPVAIAGVMGGERSGVQTDTQDVFLECAYFAPLAIAGTARRYGLHTDASHRYERGVDHDLQHRAMERATQLLVDIVGGQVGPVIETVEANHLPVPNQVSVSAKRIDQLLGVHVTPEQVDEAFARLDFEVISRTTEGSDVQWTITAPSHRFDIAQEADLVEEVCRIYGYNNIPSKQPQTHLSLREVELTRSSETQLKHRLAHLGFQEVITYSFIDPTLQDLLDPGVEPVALANPMSSEQSVMRTNLLPGLVHTAQTNRARQQDRVMLFELGLVFQPGAQGLAQPLVLGGLMWGQRQSEAWHQNSEEMDFYDIKGCVDGLLEWSGLKAEFSRADDGVLHPGQSASIVIDGKTCGRIGRLHPEIEAQIDLQGVFVFELDAQQVLNRPKRRYAGLSRYPSVRRDLAVVVDKSVALNQVQEIVQQCLSNTLVDFKLFDVYEGKGIDSNEKSLGLGLTLQSQNATLTDEEVSSLVQKVMDELTTVLQARLR